MKLQEIKEIVIESTGIDINKRRNDRDFADVIRIFCYVSWRYCDEYITYNKLGKYAGNRNHATMIHHTKSFHNIYETDARFKQQADKIIDKIKTIKEDSFNIEVNIDNLDYLMLRNRYNKLKHAYHKLDCKARNYKNENKRIKLRVSKLLDIELKKVI